MSISSERSPAESLDGHLAQVEQDPDWRRRQDRIAEINARGSTGSYRLTPEWALAIIGAIVVLVLAVLTFRR